MGKGATNVRESASGRYPYRRAADKVMFRTRGPLLMRPAKGSLRPFEKGDGVSRPGHVPTGR